MKVFFSFAKSVRCIVNMVLWHYLHYMMVLFQCLYTSLMQVQYKFDLTWKVKTWWLIRVTSSTRRSKEDVSASTASLRKWSSGLISYTAATVISDFQLFFPDLNSFSTIITLLVYFFDIILILHIIHCCWCNSDQRAGVA